MNETSNIPEGKTLVTGAAGHVGANLVRHLLAQGVDVRVLVHPQHDNRGVAGLAVERMEGDLRDADAVARAVAGCVRVYHAGAKVSVNESVAAADAGAVGDQRDGHAERHAGFAAGRGGAGVLDELVLDGRLSPR
jgi:nucleoside-diphosphate-sugar epimerase